MDSIFGIPSHPLFVHLPAVLVPLAGIGVVVMLARAAWWDRYKWATLAVSGAGALGAILAAGSGEGLEEGVEGTASRSLLHAHAEAGETARTGAIVFFIVLLVAVVVVPWWARRRAGSESGSAATSPAVGLAGATAPRWLRPIVVVALVVSAGAASWTVYDAGHSGAKSVWGDVKAGEGRERGEGHESGKAGEGRERGGDDD